MSGGSLVAGTLASGRAASDDEKDGSVTATSFSQKWLLRVKLVGPGLADVRFGPAGVYNNE